ncbi:Uma2 family endonuclease [Streptomyces sp. NPDC003077]|uniref:Uma2 family endonuclease n=1 Tax=Streptomyces sp. NPDC003077 TaxID=3154443 RepID=UPI0033B6B784
MTYTPIDEWILFNHRRPPQGAGFTVEDLYKLPDLPRHTELIDGCLMRADPQTDFHSVVLCMLYGVLRRSATDGMWVIQQMTVVLDRYNAPEPDLSVVHAKAVRDRTQDRFEAEDVVLAVEAVARDTRERDERVKARKYAAAGIPYFWLVEPTGRRWRPQVRTHELDAQKGCYVPTGTYRGRLHAARPFTIDVDLDVLLDRL